MLINRPRFRRLWQRPSRQTRTRERYIGQKIPVIIEDTHPDSPYLLCGRFSGQAPEIDGMVIINDARKVKNVPELYEVEITDVIDYDLIGKAIRSLEKKTSFNMLI